MAHRASTKTHPKCLCSCRARVASNGARARACARCALQHANVMSPVGAGCSTHPASMDMMLTCSKRPRFTPRAQTILQCKVMQCTGSAPVRARQTCAGMCDYNCATHVYTRYLRAHESNELLNCIAAPCAAAVPFVPSSAPSQCPHRAAKKWQEAALPLQKLAKTI